nr:MAG: replication initiator protein [Microvirus sp.]QQL13310.1 MAG: replication initiator protein [Microviridae sp.]
MCEHPVVLYQELLMPSGAIEVQSIKVPCGRCESCLLVRQAMWRIRLNEEFRNSSGAVFFTLTYDEDHVPYVDCLTDEELNTMSFRDQNIRQSLKPVKRLIECKPNVYYTKTVCKRDIQLFLKRLRKTLYPRKVRYFICSEYGPETQRPHYHGILFDYEFNPQIDREKQLAELQELLKSTWQNGFVRCDPCVGSRLNYCAKYCVKPYGSLDPSKVPPFILCSRRPAIGASYLDSSRRVEWYLSKYSSTYVAPDFNGTGKVYKSKLPKYYADKIFGVSTDERRFLNLANRVRRIFGEDYPLDFISDIGDSELRDAEKAEVRDQCCNPVRIQEELRRRDSRQEKAHNAVLKAHKKGKRQL